MDVLVTSLFRVSIEVLCNQCGIRRRNTSYLRLDAYRRLMRARLAGTSLNFFQLKFLHLMHGSVQQRVCRTRAAVTAAYLAAKRLRPKMQGGAACGAAGTTIGCGGGRCQFES